MTMELRSSITWAVARLSGSEEVEGQGLVEYSLILLLVVIACLSALGTLSATAKQVLFEVAGAMP